MKDEKRVIPTGIDDLKEEEKIRRESVKYRILKVIRGGEGTLTSEIVEKVDYDTWTVLELIDELLHEGLIM
jgi:hypothetical protein